MSHVKNLMIRVKEWSLCERIEKKLPTHNVNTSNFVEISMRITKDQTMGRMKAFNLAELLVTLFEDSSSYYELKLIDIGNNRSTQMMASNVKSKFKTKPTHLNKER